MKTKTLIFFIDAVRPDYITKKDTPFLYKLKKTNTYLKVKSLLGYSSGIHPSIWTGKYQEKHGFFLVYHYDPKNSIFKWIKFLSFIPKKIRTVLLSSLKAPYYMFNFKNLFPKWYKENILPIPASIDPKQARFFNLEKEEYNPKFFEILKQNKITFSSNPDFDHRIYGKGIRIPNWRISKNNLDFYFVYETDPIGHYFGPKSKELKEKMKEIDSKISELYNYSIKNYKKVNLFIFSDHGMVEIKDTINIKQIIDKSDLKPIKDYIVFYDSTMVRFWVNNNKTKRKIINLLSNVKHLTYLDEKLKERYKIRFKTRKWGDLMFLADPGYRIFPDYFAPVRFNTKGMHGYWPEHPKSKGIFITNTFKTRKREINIVDIMPTILKAIDLEKSIPKDIDGKPIF